MTGKSLIDEFKIQKLGDLVNIKTGKLDANASSENGKYPFFTCSITPLRIDTYSYDCECVLVAGNGDLNVKYYNGKFDAYQRTYIIESKDKLYFDTKYLYYFMSKYIDILRNQSIGGVIKYIKLGNLTEAKVPVPKIETQKKIVEVLERAEKALEKRIEAIKLLDELVKSKFIEMFGDPVLNSMNLPKVELGKLGDWKTGGTPSRSNNDYFNGNIPWLSSGELNNIYCYGSTEMVTELAIKESAAKIIEKGSLLLGMYDTAALKSTINMIECSCNQAIAYAKLDEKLVNTVYIYYCIQIGKDFYKSQQRGVRQKNLNLSMIKGLEVLMPDLELQNKFANFANQVHKLKLKMEESLKELEDNFNSLMQRAFKGEIFK
ncbi:restriction endonuclease subunit S [Fervidicella metallireducens AeB]|uniref:Restriction endonuclease subunit S n=1 Tax=Fervidicella metallireducens AeB TaxID=1403537 RepID=A0A017S068_9CLOT|nr:restriction endonuclease subunit S [Fervidicella metallireducens]EYE89535.1 restriction endonuclease subunit S [Fervidicella metallireducens AeB]